MNALYDAPVDADGKPLFADVPVRERVLMRADEKALVQYGCDGERFAVSVRDAFGTLRKETILQYLDKCLHADPLEQIDRKAGGAGLGLYLICQLGLRGRLPHLRRLGHRGDLQLRPHGRRARSCARSASSKSASSTRARADRARSRTIPTRRGRRHEDLAPRAPPPRARPLLPVMMTLRRAAARLRRRRWRRCPTCAGRPPRRCASRPIRRARSSTSTAAAAAPRRSSSTPRPAAATPCAPYAPAFATTSSSSPPPPATRRCAYTSMRLAATLAVETEPAGARVFVDGKETRQADARRRSSCRRRRR